MVHPTPKWMEVVGGSNFAEGMVAYWRWVESQAKVAGSFAVVVPGHRSRWSALYQRYWLELAQDTH